MGFIRAYVSLCLVICSLLLLEYVTTEGCSNCASVNMTCVNGVCLPRCVNVTSSGECLQCRDFRFYGQQCENVCPHNCLNSRCQLINSRTVCTEGCVTDKKGENCEVDCPASCKKCDRYSDKCLGPCSNSMFYGDRCVVPCLGNCGRGCDKDTGECDNCTVGYKGRYCNETCPQICKDGCDRGSGVCNNCTSGYKGKFCNENCSSYCIGGCHRYRGECNSCKADQKGQDCPNCPAGLYGKYCNETCPLNCSICFKLTGICEKCDDGYRGIYCNITCPNNCDKCDRDTGLCSQCNQDYKDVTCNVTSYIHCSADIENGTCIACFSKLYLQKGSNCSCINNILQCSVCADWHVTEADPDSCIPCTEIQVDAIMGPTSGIGLTIIGIVLLTTVLVGITLFFIIQIWKRRRKRWKISENSFKNTKISDNPMLAECTCDTLPTTECFQAINPTYILQADDGDMQHVTLCEELTGERSIDHIMEEFQKLPRPDISKSKCGSLEENYEKNRYTDVTPYDETRVSLEVRDDEENDYINASYIKGYTDEIQYVAAQGPNCETVNDFWRMIWQLNTTKLVMLTNLVEAGKVKCEMYWPFCNSEYQSYGKVCVQCVEENVYQYYTLRTLAVWKDTFEKRTVHQFHFTAWPDHGVSEDTKSIIDFHRVVMDTGSNHQGLMVIHCSAGVGRSGTFLAFDYLLDQTEQEGRVCVFKCVENLRLQRMKMVQTKVQYKFLYDLVIDALQHRSSSPVYIQCKECWDVEKKTDRESAGSDTDYHVLWECGMQERDSSNSESDVLLMVDDTSPHQPNTSIKMEPEDDIKISFDSKQEKQITCSDKDCE